MHPIKVPSSHLPVLKFLLPMKCLSTLDNQISTSVQQVSNVIVVALKVAGSSIATDKALFSSKKC